MTPRIEEPVSVVVPNDDDGLKHVYAPPLIQQKKREAPSVPAEEASLRHHLEHSDLEVLVVVEGIEPYTSSTLMARHSYNYKAGEILFNHAFPPCVDLATDGAAIIDLDKFNETIKTIPNDYISSSIIPTPSIV